MPPPSRRGRGARISTTTRSLSSRINPPRSSSPGLSANVHLQVTGWRDSKAASNEDGGIQAFTSWLERKARTIQDKSPHHGGIQKRSALRIRKSRIEGSILNIHVAADEALYFQKLDGFTWAGSAIQIRTIGTTAGSHQPRRDTANRQLPLAGNTKPAFSFKSKDNESLVTTLKNLLSRRYNIDTKVLNLSEILEEPEVKEVLSSNNNTMSKLFAALSALCEDAFPTKEARAEGITGIQLGGNKFTSLLPARALAWEFPELLNLDLSNNNIQGLDGLNHFRKCTKLQHIILAGNPWVQQSEFKNQVLRTFPNLQFVDGVEITEADRKGVKHLAAPPIAPGAYEDTTGLGQKFLQNFFVGFDSDRKALVDYYYDSNSVFSFAVNTRALRDPNSRRDTTKGEWDEWIYNSRNLLKLNQPSARKTRSHRGPANIRRAMDTLPKTQHPSFDDLSKWMIECFPMEGLKDPSGQSPTGVNGLCVIVHGEFVENGDVAVKRKLRSFDRTFILGPGGNNPDGVGVVSDILSVRGYGGTKAFQPSSNVPMSPEDERAAMVAEVQRQTNMTEPYATMCLEQTAWNVAAAVESFQQVRANIPPEAFL